jgi:hypothetical protein
VKSLKNRLKDIIPEVLDYTKQYGRSAAMDKFGVRDYVRFVKFLTEVTHDPNFGIAPINRPSVNYKAPITEYMGECAAIAHLTEMDARIKATIARKKRRLAELEQKIFEAEEQLYSDRDYIPCEVRI